MISVHPIGYFLLFGLCVKADPAADLADLLVLLLRNVLDAALPALDDVVLLGAFVCESADPAADLADLYKFLFNSLLFPFPTICICLVHTYILY